MTKARNANRVSVESLPAAAAAITTGAKLVGVNRVSQGRFEFIIQGPDAEMDVAGFTLGTLEVNARDFMRVFDDLRTAIRNEQRAGGGR